MDSDAVNTLPLPEELVERVLAHLAPLPCLDESAFVEARQQLVRVAQASEQLRRLAGPLLYCHTRFNKHFADESVFLHPARAALVRTARLEYETNAAVYYEDVKTLRHAPHLEEVEVVTPPGGFELDDLVCNVPNLKHLALLNIDRLVPPPEDSALHLISLTLQGIRMPQYVAEELLQPLRLPSLAVLTLGYFANLMDQQFFPQLSPAFLDQLDCLILLPDACYSDLSPPLPPIHTSTPILLPYRLSGDFPVLPFQPGSIAPVHIHCFADLPPPEGQHVHRGADTLVAIKARISDLSAFAPAAIWLHPIFHPSHACHERAVEYNPYLSKRSKDVLVACEERGVMVDYYTREEEGRSLETARPPAAFWRYAKELKRARAGP
ncbi:hypothetical protein JCM10207_006327 [Rhodosporidiobolus poonsookiae]